MNKSSEERIREAVADMVETLDPDAISEFDRVTKLAARILDVPICLISLVESERQFFAGAAGLQAPLCDLRETPLTHSFCRTVVASESLVVVPDSTKDDRFCNNPAIEELGVAAYLGFPLVDSDGNILGAFCLIDTKARSWEKEEIAIARDFAAMASSHIHLHMERIRQRALFDVVMHDLKNPLTAVSFGSNLLKEQKGELPDNLRPLVDTVSESADNAFQLLEQVGLRFREEPPAEPCDLGKTLVTIGNRYSEQAANKSIALKLNSAGAGSLAVVDEWLIMRVAENLVGNAVKFTPNGGTINVSLLLKGDKVGFSIVDSGPGFTAEDLKNLYRRYSRLSAQPTGQESSSGLGLSIARQLAAKAGGSLELVSQPGESAHFEVLFPLLEA